MTTTTTAARAADALDERPTITISTRQREVVDTAERALLALEPQRVYVRAGALVHVVHDVSESHGLAYPDGQPVIRRVGRERLRELLGEAAIWERRRATPKGDVTEECMCPPWVAATLEQRGEWRLPAIDGISDAPVLRPDGSIHDRPGYDRATRVIYDPGDVRYPDIPARPSRDAARRAYADLVEPMCDVPYVADTDRAAWSSLVLTLAGRSAIDGCTPLHLVRAPVRGAGKGLVVDAAATIATGRAAPKRPPATTEDELRKALLAYALESPALVTLDNVEGALGSPTLAMVLTAGAISDRLLGVSESRTVPVRYVLAATGNNLQLRGDVGRRVVPVDLDPRCEHPEDRGGWRYPDLLAHIRRERPRLVAAALTILRAYVVADRPAHGMPRMGSYEAWDALVRGAIVWASDADPLGGVQRIRDDGDEDAERLRAMLVAWHDLLGEAPYTVAEAIKRAGDSGDLHDALVAYCSSGTITSRRIGDVLRRYRGRICAGHELVRGDETRDGVRRWRVSAGSAGSAGSATATRARDPDLDLGGLRSDPADPSDPSPDVPRSDGPTWEPYAEEDES